MNIYKLILLCFLWSQGLYQVVVTAEPCTREFISSDLTNVFYFVALGDDGCPAAGEENLTPLLKEYFSEEFNVQYFDPLDISGPAWGNSVAWNELEEELNMTVQDLAAWVDVLIWDPDHYQDVYDVFPNYHETFIVNFGVADVGFSFSLYGNVGSEYDNYQNPYKEFASSSYFSYSTVSYATTSDAYPDDIACYTWLSDGDYDAAFYGDVLFNDNSVRGYQHNTACDHEDYVPWGGDYISNEYCSTDDCTRDSWSYPLYFSTGNGFTLVGQGYTEEHGGVCAYGAQSVTYQGTSDDNYEVSPFATMINLIRGSVTVNKEVADCACAQETEADHSTEDYFELRNGGGSSYHMLDGSCIYSATVKSDTLLYLHVSEFDLANSASLTVNDVAVLQTGTTEIGIIPSGLVNIEFTSNENTAVISGKDNFHVGYVICVSEYSGGCSASTSAPTMAPTSPPTVAPTGFPTEPPVSVPTSPPTVAPTGFPTEPPVSVPTSVPTDPLTEVPTEPPTEVPTDPLTEVPTDPLTEVPTEPPTEAPTDPLTEVPTESPTEPPTLAPSEVPTEPPTDPLTEVPTEPPTEPPADPPTEVPTEPPTEVPTEPPIVLSSAAVCTFDMMTVVATAVVMMYAH